MDEFIESLCLYLQSRAVDNFEIVAGDTNINTLSNEQKVCDMKSTIMKAGFIQYLDVSTGV